jgi:type III restriction enzyme
MLREGFDVNNICVIVPLRSSQAQILLEQTIGRGLRLMWRDPEFADLKRENRERINAGQEPGSLVDILSIVENPAFQAFYDDLIAAGLMGSTTDDDDGSSIGDLVPVDRRYDYEEWDFAIPFLLREQEETLEHSPIDVGALSPFTAMERDKLAGMLGKGDTFTSQDLQSSTLFGDYRVAGAVMDVSGYNEWLSRITRRVGQSLNQPLPKGNRIAEHLATPYLQVGTAALATAIDDYVRGQLFGGPFEPFENEAWRLLMLQPVVDHIVKVVGLALAQSEEREFGGSIEVLHRRLSEVPRLMMRESTSMAVTKCIYPRQGWPARSGGLERAFIEWAQADSAIEAFCKVSENRHDFARMRYLREDGLPAFYFPDFLVRTVDSIYMAETKAQQQTSAPNVQRKLRAATSWCARINALPPEQRGGREWHYALVGESTFHDWRDKGGRLGELLGFCRIRQQDRQAQGELGL